MIRLGSAWVALLVLLPGLAGCGLTDGVDRQEAHAALEQQREDALVSARELLAAADERVSAEVVSSEGRWEGCDSTFMDEFRNFEYLATARLDVEPGGASLVPHLEEALTGAGYTLAESGDPNRVIGENGDLTARFWDLPGPGDARGDVVFEIDTGCVDVPEDERDEWLVKDDPSPGLG